MAQRFGVMQPQDLDIVGPKPGLLDRRHDFRQCRDIAAGEDIFADPGIGDPGTFDAADGVHQRHPVGGQEVAHLQEIFPEMVDADVFEHAHRDDAVEDADLIPVVAEMKPDPVRQSGVSGPLPGHLQLLGRQRQAGDVGAGLAGQINPHAPPNWSRYPIPCAPVPKTA